MTLEELEIKFTADMGGLKGDLNGIKNQLGGIENPAGKAQGALGGLAKLGKVFAGAAIGAKLLDIGKDSIAMANDAVESENLFEVSMGEMAKSTRDWSNKLSKSLGLNAVAVRKNVGTFNVMFKSMGLGADKAQDMSQSLTELAQDMASFYNLSPDEAFQKLSAGITGEAEPLKRLGILIDENTIKTYAYTNGIAENGAELTQQQKTLARYGAIMEQTSTAQGDLARTMDSPTNKLRQMSAQVDAAKIALGTALQPALLAVLPVLTSLAVGVGDVIKGLTGVEETETKSLSGVAFSLAEATVIVESNLGTATKDLVDAVTDLKTKTDASFAAYATAVTVTKKVLAEIKLLASTTGEERFKEIVDELILSTSGVQGFAESFIENTLTPAYVNGDINKTLFESKKKLINASVQKLATDTEKLEAKISAMVQAALGTDGVVDDKELANIKTTLTTGANTLLKDQKIVADKITATVNAMVKAGALTGEEGKTILATLQPFIDESAALVTGLTAKVDAAVSVGNWLAVTLTPDQVKKVQDAVQAEADSATNLIVDASAQVTGIFSAGLGSTFEGSTLQESLTTIFSGAQTTIAGAAANIDAAFAEALKIGMTPKLLKTIDDNRETIREMILLSTKGVTPKGEWLIALDGFTGLTIESAKKFSEAYAKYLKEGTDGYNQIAKESIATAYSMKDQLIAAGMTEKEFADYITAIETTLATRLSALQSGAIIDAAKTLAPAIAAAIKSGDKGQVKLAAQSVLDVVKGIDLSTLSAEARAAAVALINSLNDGLKNLSVTEANPFIQLQAEALATLPHIKQTFGDKGKEVMASLLLGLMTGKITQAQYNTILNPNASAAELQALKVEFLKSGNEAAAKLVQGMLEKLAEVEAAAAALAAATEVKPASTYNAGVGVGMGIYEGMNSTLAAIKRKAIELAKAATDPIYVTTEVESPSKLTTRIGEYIGEGLALGMLDTTGMVSSAADKLAGSAITPMSGLSAPSIGFMPPIAPSNIVEQAINGVLERLNINLYIDQTQLGKAVFDAVRHVNAAYGFRS